MNLRYLAALALAVLLAYGLVLAVKSDPEGARKALDVKERANQH